MENDWNKQIYYPFHMDGWLIQANLKLIFNTSYNKSLASLNSILYMVALSVYV